jgi:hypothetical protein
LEKRLRGLESAEKGHGDTGIGMRMKRSERELEAV